MRTPVFMMDKRAWDILEKHGTNEATKVAWCENFLKLSGMAEHDYLHQLVHPIIKHTDASFSQSQNHTSFYHEEEHALALHASICSALFDKPISGPRRKAAILKTATALFDSIHEMQQAAYATKPNVFERLKIDEACTYLAEIACHRLFRIFPPNSAEFRSIESIENIQLNSRGVSATHLTPPPHDNWELLQRHTRHVLGSLYDDIHRITHTSLEATDGKRYSLTEAVAALAHKLDTTLMPGWAQRYSANRNQPMQR